MFLQTMTPALVHSAYTQLAVKQISSIYIKVPTNALSLLIKKVRQLLYLYNYIYVIILQNARW
jgi:hypothetical protein